MCLLSFTFDFIFFHHITVLWLHLGFICTTKLGGVLLIRALFPTMTVTGTTKTLFQTLALFFFRQPVVHLQAIAVNKFHGAWCLATSRNDIFFIFFHPLTSQQSGPL